MLQVERCFIYDIFKCLATIHWIIIIFLLHGFIGYGRQHPVYIFLCVLLWPGGFAVFIAHINHLPRVRLGAHLGDTAVIRNDIPTGDNKEGIREGTGRNKCLFYPFYPLLYNLRITAVVISIYIINQDYIGADFIISGTPWRLPRTNGTESNTLTGSKFS